MGRTSKNLKLLGLFTFLIAPVFAWGSVIASDETAVFASLSRMIWYSGSELRILIAMLVMFVPMLIYGVFRPGSRHYIGKTENADAFRLFIFCLLVTLHF